jgi:ankyrin repeat protein
MSASSQGHVETVKLLLSKLKEAGLSSEDVATLINTASFSGGTSVMFSAHAGSFEITKLLLEHGADITLHAQATSEYLENYAKAIEDGTIDVNAEDFEHHVDGVTSLTVAAQKGHLEVCDLLLDHDADIHAKDDEDRTALLMAVAGNFGELATLLISKGADPNTVYVDDENASHNLLMDAIIVENEEFASLLTSSGADIYFVDDTKVSTLLQASHRGLEAIVEGLLEKHVAGGDEGSIQSKYIDYPSEEGITPLIAAASEGHTGILKLLITSQAEVNAKDKDGTTALMAASARGHLEAVKALIDAGAKINEQNEDGHSALMFAYNGKTQVETLWERYTQLLSENSGKEDEADGGEDGGTGPIIQEALANHTNLVNLLIEKGADATLKDKEGHMASDFDYHPDLDGEVMEKEEMKEKMRDSSRNEL